MGKFLETVAAEYNRVRAITLAGDYSGVTHAGLAIVAHDTGNVLLAQRAYDETDDEDVRETWEFPSGGLECVKCLAAVALPVPLPTTDQTSARAVSLDLDSLRCVQVTRAALGLPGVYSGGSDAQKHVVTASLSGEVAKADAGSVLANADADASRGVAGVVDGVPSRDRTVDLEVEPAVEVLKSSVEVGAPVAGSSGSTGEKKASVASEDSVSHAAGEHAQGYDVVHSASVPPGLTHEGAHEYEQPLAAAIREYGEEVALPLPVGMVVNGWRSGPQDNYQGFVYTIDTEFDLSGFVPNEETQAVAWVDMADTDLPIRPEMADFDVSLLDVSQTKEDAMTAAMGEPDEIEPLTEPDITLADIAVDGIPVHGVLAPEDVETSDGRGFNSGAMTARPGRLPFSWQIQSNPGHDKSVVTGSVDRMMRKDGLIHWDGRLMPSATAGEFTEQLAFFGRFGVSVDGDKGEFDAERSGKTGVTWFKAVRAAGLTAVAIPAFHEAYVALGPHPDMPSDATLVASMVASGDLVTFDRGPGWVTNPVETKRIHDYWTKKGEEGYAKINWGTPGDFTRAKKLIGAKIAANSPEDMRYLNQIIAQWHFDALGYWPGELGKPGNAPDTPENRRRAARHAAANKGIVVADDIEKDGWEAVMVASAGGKKVRPPKSYFEKQEGSGSLYIAEEPDENGFRQTYGYAGEFGVCHIGYDNRCVEIPVDDDFSDFHLGYTRTNEGIIRTGVIAYLVDHHDAATILTQTPEQSHFDNVANAWAQVRLGYDERGIWFAGVVLPGISEEDITLIEATGQVSGEWKYGALRALQSVNTPGYGVKSSAEFDEKGNVIALVASAHNLSGCEPTPAERVAALAKIEAEERVAALRGEFAKWSVSGNEVS